MANFSMPNNALSADTKNTHLKPGPARAAGAALGLLAIAAHAVALWLWSEGLQHTEQDEAARQALLAMGVLLACGQLAAFTTASALPVHALRVQRWMLHGLGVLLVAAEVAAAALGHLGLTHAAQATGEVERVRMAELQRSLESRRAAVQSWRALAGQQAAQQATSEAAKSLRKAEAADDAAQALAVELAQLQGMQRPQLTAPLRGVAADAFVIVRAGLAPLMGLVLASVAGALWREARRTGAPSAVAPVRNPAETRSVLGGVPVQLVGGRFMTFAAAPLAALATVPAAAAMAPASTPETAAPRPGPVHDAPGPQEQALHDRYTGLLEAVRAGKVTPSVRGLREALGGGSTDVLRRYLVQMVQDGVTQRVGRGYEVKKGV